jgi:hypothetical protein
MSLLTAAMSNGLYRAIDNEPAVTLTPGASYSRLRSLPLLALSHNSIFPSLAIGPLGVTIRVVRRHSFAYDDLAGIHFDPRLGYRLTFEPRLGWREFTVIFTSRESAATAVSALVDFGAPVDPKALVLTD